MDMRMQVYDAVAKIPRGKVATYGQIARIVGAPQAARAVGYFMRTNTDTNRVPCHRVVGHDGALVGYAFDGVAEKRKLLIDEGVSFRGPRVNLSVSLWTPDRT